MYRFVRSLLLLLVFPLLSGSTSEKLTVEDVEKIKNNRDYYEVIQATTGKKEQSQFYAGDFEVRTHIEAVSAVKKALANEGINTSKVRIELYYDPLFIGDDLPPRVWNAKSHSNTITSPWLDLTKTVTISGESRITIRIDATAARVVNDLFAESSEKDNISDFLEIPSIRESCFSWMTAQYTESIVKGGLNSSRLDSSSLYCAPESLRKPLISLFRSATPSIGSLDEPVIFKLIYDCQDAARKYYSELYPLLAVEGLELLKHNSEYDLQWWKKVVERAEPIESCK